MALTTSEGILIGTSETSLASISNNATLNSTSPVDILQNNTSGGDLAFYLPNTSTVTAGTFDVSIYEQLTSGGQNYLRLFKQIAPINGTQYTYVGRISSPRYLYATVKNNATGVTGSVALLWRLIQQQ